jgi:hypothetical protein
MVRPFYNRGGSVPIIRTFLDRIGTRNLLGVPSLTLGPLVLGATHTLLVALAYDQFASGALDVTTFNGNPMNLAASVVDGALADYNHLIYYLPMLGVATTANLVADFSTGVVNPKNAAMIAIRVSGLQQAPLANDQNQTNAPPGPSGTQDSGFTANTAWAREFVWGSIMTNGAYPGDVAGLWTAPLVAGQRIGTTPFPAIDLKEGYFTASAIAAFRSRITGATSRTYSSICSTFRGA